MVAQRSSVLVDWRLKEPILATPSWWDRRHGSRRHGVQRFKACRVFVCGSNDLLVAVSVISWPQSLCTLVSRRGPSLSLWSTYFLTQKRRSCKSQLNPRSLMRTKTQSQQKRASRQLRLLRSNSKLSSPLKPQRTRLPRKVHSFASDYLHESRKGM